MEKHLGYLLAAVTGIACLGIVLTLLRMAMRDPARLGGRHRVDNPVPERPPGAGLVVLNPIAGWWDVEPADDEPTPIHDAAGPPALDLEGFTTGWHRRGELLAKVQACHAERREQAGVST